MLRVCVLLVFLFVCGCASTGDSKGRRDAAPEGALRDSNVAPDSGIWGILDESLRSRRNARETVDLQAGAATLPDGWKEKIDRWWQYWRRDLPEWPAKREEWVSLGSQAEKILVENLIRYYVIAWDHGSESEVRRAEREIMGFRQLAPVYVIEALSQGFGDDVVRNIVGDLLARMNPEVVARIEEVFDDASLRGRRSLARSLKKMKTERAIPLLIRIAEGKDPWETRIEAIQGLGRLRTPRAIPAMLACLRDDDRSIRKFAARSIVMSGVASREVFEGLIKCMERSLRETQLETARRCNDSLRILTGQRFKADPRSWRRWMESGKGRRG